jgi:uncharacterized protein (DUF433 family)
MKSGEVETAAPVTAEIIDRGRGPEINGTRITVYDVLDYVLECWPADRIAAWFNLRTEQIEAAVEYAREHKIEVLKDYIEILERCERGNPPELQAKLDANHERFLKLVEQVRQVQSRAKAEIHELIEKHRSGQGRRMPMPRITPDNEHPGPV